MAQSSRFTIAAAIACLLAWTACASAAPLKLKGKGEMFAYVPVTQHTSTRLQVDITYRWRVWTLLGEPVQTANIKWKLPATALLPLPPEAEGAVVRLDELPGRVAERIELYDVILAVRGRLRATGAIGFFLIDTGVPKRAGKGWSFNFPGSPSWSELLFERKVVTAQDYSVRDPDNYVAYSAAKAKSLVPGFVPFKRSEGFELVSAKLDISAVWNWWREKLSAEKRYEAYAEAANRGAGALRRLMGADTGPVDRKLQAAREAATKRDYVRAVKLARQAAAPFDKVLPAAARLPVQISTEDGRTLSLEELYETERSSLEKELNSALRAAPKARPEASLAAPWQEAKRRELEARPKIQTLEPVCKKKENSYNRYERNLCGYRDSVTGEMAIGYKFVEAGTFKDGKARIVLDFREWYDKEACGHYNGYTELTVAEINQSGAILATRKEQFTRKLYTLCMSVTRRK